MCFAQSQIRPSIKFLTPQFSDKFRMLFTSVSGKPHFVSVEVALDPLAHLAH